MSRQGPSGVHVSVSSCDSSGLARRGPKSARAARSPRPNSAATTPRLPSRRRTRRRPSPPISLGPACCRRKRLLRCAPRERPRDRALDWPGPVAYAGGRGPQDGGGVGVVVQELSFDLTGTSGASKEKYRNETHSAAHHVPPRSRGPRSVPPPGVSGRGSGGWRAHSVVASALACVVTGGLAILLWREGHR